MSPESLATAVSSIQLIAVIVVLVAVVCWFGTNVSRRKQILPWTLSLSQRAGTPLLHVEADVESQKYHGFAAMVQAHETMLTQLSAEQKRISQLLQDQQSSIKTLQDAATKPTKPAACQGESENCHDESPAELDGSYALRSFASCPPPMRRSVTMVLDDSEVKDESASLPLASAKVSLQPSLTQDAKPQLRPSLTQELQPSEPRVAKRKAKRCKQSKPALTEELKAAPQTPATPTKAQLRPSLTQDLASTPTVPTQPEDATAEPVQLDGSFALRSFVASSPPALRRSETIVLEPDAPSTVASAPQLRPSLTQELEAPARTPTKPQLRPSLTQELEEPLRTDSRPQLRPSLTQELEAPARTQPKPQLRPSLTTQLEQPLTIHTAEPEKTPPMKSQVPRLCPSLSRDLEQSQPLWRPQLRS